MSGLLALYHALPAPLRDLAASTRGLSLRRWRYGPETDRLIEAALEREHWSAAAWKADQEQRLESILHRAATRVPYYRAQWDERRRNGDTASWAYLENWPVLDKQAIRANARAFLADDVDPRSLFAEHTSGTSGTPLTLWWSRSLVRQWFALMEARWRGWYGVSRHDRWAILGGQVIVPARQQTPPFWARNYALNQVYMSSYHLAPGRVSAYADALERYQVTYVWGYTSSLHMLAQELNRQNRRIPMKVVIANAEPIYDYQREAIEQAFACAARETYGMAEAVTAASECEAGHLHRWPELGVTETGDAGELICTGLLNEAMPLVRYRVGDSARLAPEGTRCACGRTLPVIESIEGRSDDLLYAPDGRRVGRLDPVFKRDLPIREAQIIQETLTAVRVLVVPTEAYTAAAGAQIAEQIRLRLGFVDVTVETADSIPRLTNGKFKAVVCRLSPDEIARAKAMQ